MTAKLSEIKALVEEWRTKIVNGEQKQDGRTSALLFDCTRLLCAISAVMTLLPGDVIVGDAAMPRSRANASAAGGERTCVGIARWYSA